MTPQEHIDGITSAIDHLEAALAQTPEKYRLRSLAIMIETLKAWRAELQAELKRRMH